MALAAAVVWRALDRPPAPPLLGDLGPVAPEVEAVVRQQAAAVEQSPRDALRWAQLGMACEANGLVVQARDAYRTASRLDPTSAKWLYRLSSVEARTGAIDGAIGELRRAAVLAPDYAPIHWRLGLLLLDANQIDAAAAEFTRATRIDPHDDAGWIGVARVALQRGDNEEAADLLGRRLAGGPVNRYVMELLGTALERLGRHDEASALLAAGTAEPPVWADAWTDEMLEWRRGFAVRLKDATAAFAEGDHRRAIHLLEQLVQEKPEDMPLLSHLGEAYVEAGRLEDGARVLDRVVGREPDRVDAWVRLAYADVQLGRFADAQQAIDRALARDASYAPAQETLGLLLWRTGQERAALSAMRTACRSDPRNTRALVWAGMLQTNLGQVAPALASFTQATRIDPTLVAGWLGIANARMSMRDLSGARTALARASMLAGDAPAVRETAARLEEMQAGREPAKP